MWTLFTEQLQTLHPTSFIGPSDSQLGHNRVNLVQVFHSPMHIFEISTTNVVTTAGGDKNLPMRFFIHVYALPPNICWNVNVCIFAQKNCARRLLKITAVDVPICHHLSMPLLWSGVRAVLVQYFATFCKSNCYCWCKKFWLKSSAKWTLKMI